MKNDRPIRRLEAIAGHLGNGAGPPLESLAVNELFSPQFEEHCVQHPKKLHMLGFSHPARYEMHRTACLIQTEFRPSRSDLSSPLNFEDLFLRVEA